MTVKNHTCYCRHLIEMWWQIYTPSAFVDEANLDTYNIGVRAGLRAFPEEAVEKKGVMTGCESTMGPSSTQTLTWQSWLRKVFAINKLSNAVWRNAMLYSLNLFCSCKTTVPFLYSIELHVTVSNIKIWLQKNAILCRGICVVGHNETYVRLYVNCRIFLSDFKHLWIFSTHFHKSSQ